MRAVHHWIIWRILPTLVATIGVSFYLSATGHNRLLKPTNVYHELKWALYHISQHYDLPGDVGLTEEGLVDAYIKRQTPIAQDGILANIGPNGSKCGGAKVSNPFTMFELLVTARS